MTSSYKISFEPLGKGFADALYSNIEQLYQTTENKMNQTEDNSKIPCCEVYVTVALSESGHTRCCMANSHWMQERIAHDKFMEELRADKKLWACKTVRVLVQVPNSYEDMEK